MIYHGDLFDVLPTLPDASIDACVTDPPYGIGFMGREWDTFKPGAVRQPERYAQPIESDNPNLRGRRRSPAMSPSQVEYDYSVKGLRKFQEWCELWGREVYRVLKPGGYIVSCGAPRAYHRMTSGLEDAGFEIRDCLAWLFGSGFPKSLNIGDGLGTALKPAHEPIVLARKPFKGSVRENVATHGTGALNIDACRIAGLTPVMQTLDQEYKPGFLRSQGRTGTGEMSDAGRWPANVVLDDIAAMVLDEQSGQLTTSSGELKRTASIGYGGSGSGPSGFGYGDTGGASRFYYVAKPSREERDFGCDSLPRVSAAEITGRKEGSAGLRNPRAGVRAGSMDRDTLERAARNIHPTVKPVELMRWLVRLVTPINGTVLDPFTGSGTTGMACRYEQRQFIGVEREAEYIAIAERRIAAVAPLFNEGVQAKPQSLLDTEASA